MLSESAFSLKSRITAAVFRLDLRTACPSRSHRAAMIDLVSGWDWQFAAAVSRPMEALSRYAMYRVQDAFLYLNYRGTKMPHNPQTLTPEIAGVYPIDRITPNPPAPRQA
jgi:hypothetical protein